LPEPGEASGEPGAKTAALKNAILERGIALESVDDLGGALGTSSGGCIRTPELGRRTRATPEILGHGGLRYVDAELLQLAVDAWRAPEWVATRIWRINARRSAASGGRRDAVASSSQ
jgi:hypothetical protein